MTSDVLTLRIDPFVVGLEGGASIVSIEGHEQVSRPFRYWVTLRSEMLDVTAVRGTVATFRIEDRHGNVRLVSGIVAGVEAVATQSLGQSVWRLKLVPRPFTTSWRHGFRIFQEMSVPEIVKKVFADAGIEDEYFRWPDGIDGRYPKREYCVQYDESEWSFVSRLLEEEGIWYTFEHAAEPVDVGAHVMVLGETSEEAAEQSPSFLEHVWRAPDGAEGSVAAWKVESESRASIKAVALDDYDMRVPSKPLEVQAPSTSAQAKPIDEADTVPRREWYEYPGRYVDEAVGKRLARSRLEELRGRRRQLRATTNALYLQTGRRFELQQHPFADGWYFLTRLGMTIRMEGDSTEGATGQAWECSIEAVPQDQPFRPHRATRRPRIVGVQTALVTGPSGEEIHCDELGRVKVQFHWDRQRTLDEKTSCWIRVTQGHTTGSVMIPRIGWEVLVEFLEGDPDRPVCLGRVYNPLAPPDYVLPAQKTVSGLRSNSSPGAGGVNEVLFDDAAGSELLYMSSPHNVVFNVENDEMHKVVKNQTRSVGGSARFTVGGSENIAVKGAVDSSVTGAHSVTVGSRDLKVTGEIKEETTADVSITVGAAEMVQVGNPATAVLEIIASEAMAAATGAVAGAASRAEAAVLGPIAPALNAARGALGTAAQLAGPAAALFGGGSPAVAALGAAAGGASNAAGAASAGAIAAGVAQSMVGQGAAAAVAQAVSGAAGSGTWGTTVGGAVDETIGALCVHNSTYGFTMGIGGASTETIGAARAGIYTGGYCESVGAAKTEKVGVYMVKAPKGIAVDAKGAIALTIAKQTQKIGGNYSLTAKTVGAMTVSKADLKGSTVTFKCGTAEVVVSGSGIELAGVAGVTIKATGKLKLTSPNIKAV